MGYGDYPKLPDTPAEDRSPWEDWDIPELKRNYGEPVSILSHLQNIEQSSVVIYATYIIG